MSLTRLYTDLNKQLFNGQLPPFRVTLAQLPGNLQGQLLEERGVIRLRRGFDAATLRRILLHEMCHIGTPGHGSKFQAKLLRLAEHGEAWTKDEVEVYRQAPSWNEEMANLGNQLKDISRQKPRPRFSAVLRRIAELDLGLTSHELLQRVPWVPAAWAKACREADRLSTG